MANSLLSFIIFKLYFAFVLSQAPTQDLYEGSPCTLENGSRGVCKKLTDCSFRRQEAASGNRDAFSRGRCGFVDFEEIVCCNELRPAENACIKYLRWAQEIKERPHIVVYNGLRAKIQNFPYIVALGFPNDDITEDDPYPIKYNCGGSLISDRHVLTAAHCVSNIQGLVPTEVHLGSARLRDTAKSVQRIPISDIKIHPQYKRSRAYNDLAILTLQSTVIVSDTVQPICLYTKPVNTIATLTQRSFIVAGWGATSFDEDKSNLLLRTPALRMTNIGECTKYYTDFAKLPYGIVDSMICIADSNKTRASDACEGDSGGPLVLTDTGLTNIVGVTAFGQPCGSRSPGVYTAIYPFLGWIEEQVWGQNGSVI